MISSVSRDGNGNIHPLAVSCMLAAEGNLSTGAHIRAEVALNPHKAAADGATSYDGQLTIVDGAACLEEETVKNMPGMAIARCRRHFRQRMLKHKAMHRDLEAFNEITKVTRTMRRVADRLYHKLPADSVLREVPKEHLCDAYLPEGVCSHGVKLNNPAEQFNWMLQAAGVRRQKSLLKALLSLVNTLRLRQQQLETAMLAHKRKMFHSTMSDGELLRAEWPTRSAPPSLETVSAAEAARAQSLHEPKFVPEATAGDAYGKLFYVPSESVQSVNWKVDLTAVERGAYSEMCTCGLPASSQVRAPSASMCFRIESRARSARAQGQRGIAACIVVSQNPLHARRRQTRA